MHYKVSWKRYKAKVVPRLFATFSQGIDAHSFVCELIQAKCNDISVTAILPLSFLRLGYMALFSVVLEAGYTVALPASFTLWQ